MTSEELERLTKQYSGKFDLIAIGASAGGYQILNRLFSTLPKGFNLAIAVVLHRLAVSPELAVGLSASSALPLNEVEDKEPIKPGHVYLAPANYHLLIEPDRSFSLSVEEAVNFSRPSIDVLFETAAETYRERVLGVILSGASFDGAKGLARIIECRGTGLVQKPEDADQATMPAAALQHASVQLVFDQTELIAFISGLA